MSAIERIVVTVGTVSVEATPEQVKIFADFVSRFPTQAEGLEVLAHELERRFETDYAMHFDREVMEGLQS